MGKKIDVLVDGQVYVSKTTAGDVCIQEGSSFVFRYVQSNIFSGNNHEAAIEWTRPSSSSTCTFCYTEYLIDILSTPSGTAFSTVTTSYINNIAVGSSLSPSTIMTSSYNMYTDVASGHEDILGTDSDDADAAVH